MLSHIQEQSLASLPPIVKAPRDNIPLSFAQQRLWFIEQLADKGGLYHIPMILRLRGRIKHSSVEDKRWMVWFKGMRYPKNS